MFLNPAGKVQSEIEQDKQRYSSDQILSQTGGTLNLWWKWKWLHAAILPRTAELKTTSALFCNRYQQCDVFELGPIVQAQTFLFSLVFLHLQLQWKNPNKDAVSLCFWHTTTTAVMPQYKVTLGTTGPHVQCRIFNRQSTAHVSRWKHLSTDFSGCSPCTSLYSRLSWKATYFLVLENFITTNTN